MKKQFYLLSFILLQLFVLPPLWANEPLKIHYSSQGDAGKIIDISGNGYDGTLLNKAHLMELEDFTVLNLGADNGYVDLGEKVGELVSELTNFSVSTYIYVSSETDLTAAGNFVWTFSNSTDIAKEANGCLFFSVKNLRYAISLTDYSAERGVEIGSALQKGTWKHLAYVQNGNNGKIYIDGIQQKQANNISLYPKNLGKTIYNFIGRPSYSGDAYLKNTLIYDFRLYSSPLELSEVRELMGDVDALNKAIKIKMMREDGEKFTLGINPDEVREDIYLPDETENGISITWSSSNETYVTNTGVVTRPAIGAEAVKVTLTATFSVYDATATKDFVLTVLPGLSDEETVQFDENYLTENRIVYPRKTFVELPKVGFEGSTITWVSNDPEWITDEGTILKLPAKGEGNKEVTMTATFTKGNAVTTKEYKFSIAEEDEYTAYLFAYFIGNSGNQEAIRFGISRDGYNYYSLNGNEPIIASALISDKGGVRDPHILRGADDQTFYMVVTDMRSDDGWNSNHGLILLKSDDLINWTHSKIDIKALYPGFENIQSAWAPQTIYDEQAGKYMVYWSMRSPGVHEIIYYAYANEDFTAFESAPQVLFDHPDGQSCIDGDIIYHDGQYHIFFKTEGTGNGIKKAVSSNLTGGYIIEHDEYLQQTLEAVEGSCVFKMINSDTYILMYDLYSSGKYQFTESTDLLNFKAIDNAVSMDFHPRHGTVIPITEEEGARLVEKWGKGKEVTMINPVSEHVKKTNLVKDDNGNTIFLPVDYNANVSSFDPEFAVVPGVEISVEGEVDFTGGAIPYTLTSAVNNASKTYNVTVANYNNPILDGYYADPEILYSNKTGKFYLYPTSDGYSAWGGYKFKVFSSEDLVNWTDEGVFLDLSTAQVSWADGNAWAPCIEEKMIDGQYKYFFYFSGNPVGGGGKQIGVAVADDPAGPFVDSGRAILTSTPSGAGGQEIDPDVFTDPVSGKSYLYWGNSYAAVAELNDDMVSIKANTTKVITPDNTFREGIYVIYREGTYYFFWSEDDTASDNYKVRYGTSDSPAGPINVPSNNIVIQKDATKNIYGTGHNSIVQIPGKDEWYIVYHRLKYPRVSDPGNHRQVAIDKLEFNADGTVKQSTPTNEGIAPVSFDRTNIEQEYVEESNVKFYPNPATTTLTVEDMKGTVLRIYDMLGKVVSVHYINFDLETLDINNLLKGVYVMSLVKDNVVVGKERLIKID